MWVERLSYFLDCRYGKVEDAQLDKFVQEKFPEETRSALLQLPTEHLSPKPLYDLLEGLKMDLQFMDRKHEYPIKTDVELEEYAANVAGTIAELCLDLVFHYHGIGFNSELKTRSKQAGHTMGLALQLVNIARDISVDADMGRVYIPTTWLKEVDLTPESVLSNPHGPKIGDLRNKMLDKAFGFYKEARPAIEDLPLAAKGPMRVAVESYMEIGRVIREGGFQRKNGKATVPKLRRLRVAWNTL
jgi:15-cis-phytoene synthase / lycopene beta-cyclase